MLVHARALLTSSAEGATAYVDADLRDPAKILADAAGTLDLTRPVALMLIATLHFLEESDDPYAIVRELTGALAPGSYLAVSHATSDYLPPELVADIASGRHGRGRLRTEAEFTRFFDGLDLIEPGITPLAEWRAEDDEPPAPAAVGMYAGVAKI